MIVLSMPAPTMRTEFPDDHLLDIGPGRDLGRVTWRCDIDRVLHGLAGMRRVARGVDGVGACCTHKARGRGAGRHHRERQDAGQERFACGHSLSRVTETPHRRMHEQRSCATPSPISEPPTPIGSLARSVERGEAGVMIVTRTSFRVKGRTWEGGAKTP
jgi:hypothetical protein